MEMVRQNLLIRSLNPFGLSEWHLLCFQEELECHHIEEKHDPEKHTEKKREKFFL